MRNIGDRWLRFTVRLKNGDIGVNQSAEVGGLVGVAVAITATTILMLPEAPVQL